MKDFLEEVNKIPTEPGIYLMKDKDDNLIYVGKAINLRNRVRSYFQNSSNVNAKVKAMVEHIDHFDYIVVLNEVEALVLESNFIKEHAPHYNILLRDDKQYPFIEVTNEKYPRILKVRRIEDDGGKYFGPYPNAFAVNDVIELLEEEFKIRKCNLNLDKGPVLKRPCIYYSIDMCPGPCCGYGEWKDYMSNVDKLLNALDGNLDSLIGPLEEKMKDASSKLDFERAIKYREYIESINFLSKRQKITRNDDKDMDFIGQARNESRSCIQIFFMRDGKFVDQEYFIIDNEFNESDEEILSQFLKQYYLEAEYLPKELNLDLVPNDFDAISKFLSEKKGTKVSLRVPRRGLKKNQVDMVKRNAREMLNKYERKINRRERKKNIGLKDLEDLLGLRSLKRIEAYDISNIFGSQNVGSMVVFEDGQKASKEYRKFKIKSVEGPDDYSSHEEMLRRRFNRYVEEKEKGNVASGFGRLPDLIIMDGGKGQVNVSKRVLDEFGLDINVLGLVKNDKHQTRGIIFENEEYPLKVNSAIYRFLYRIQEEMHRFAINFHRSLRSKELNRSELDNIEGVGEKRKRNLLRKFRSVSNIKKQSKEKLAETDGISLQLAEKILEYFNRG